MNYFYSQMFNQAYVNPQYYNQLKVQKYHEKQSREVMNAVKATCDLCSAMRKLDKQNQRLVFDLCLAEIAMAFGKDYRDESKNYY